MGSFDKFMEDIVRREKIVRKRQRILSEREVEKIYPQRQIRRLYQERPQNRIRWGDRK